MNRLMVDSRSMKIKENRQRLFRCFVLLFAAKTGNSKKTSFLAICC